MGSLGSNSCDYEKLRNARISENQARLASLGVEKSIAELRTAISSRKPATPSPRKKYCRVMYDYTNLRRSNRLIKLQEVLECSPLRRSNRLKGKYGDPISSPEGKDSGSKPTRRRLLSSGGAEEGKRATNAPYLMVDVSKMKLSSDDVARRCNSKERGSVYNPVFGICCHFCRQKKLCGEEDCKRCGDLDMDRPCLGKTDCSVCHSSNGVLCRACLKVRYGEDMGEVRKNTKWMCPHCIEDKGVNPYWICNSSFCLKKKKMAPTGISIYKARELGYESVAHMIMDELRQTAKHR